MLNPVQYAPEQAVVQPVAEGDKIAAIVKAVVRAADAWGLSNAEAAALFDVPSAPIRACSIKTRSHGQACLLGSTRVFGFSLMAR
jgi:hypothetical protein